MHYREHLANHLSIIVMHRNGPHWHYYATFIDPHGRCGYQLSNTLLQCAGAMSLNRAMIYTDWWLQACGTYPIIASRACPRCVAWRNVWCHPFSFLFIGHTHVYHLTSYSVQFILSASASTCRNNQRRSIQ